MQEAWICTKWVLDGLVNVVVEEFIQLHEDWFDEFMSRKAELVVFD